MSIFKTPTLTTEYTGNLEQDLRNLHMEYLQKSAKMYDEFTKAFILVAILGIGFIAWELLS